MSTLSPHWRADRKYDRHFGNRSLLIDERGEHQGIAPAYDILPMPTASIVGGVDPDLALVDLCVGAIGVQPVVRARAMEAAERPCARSRMEGWRCRLTRR